MVLTAKSDDGGAVSSEDLEKSRADHREPRERPRRLRGDGSDSRRRSDPRLVSDTETERFDHRQNGPRSPSRASTRSPTRASCPPSKAGQYAGEGTITDSFGNPSRRARPSISPWNPGTYTPLVTGEQITNVTVGRASDASTDYAVNVTLNSEGAAAFAQATSELARDARSNRHHLGRRGSVGPGCPVLDSRRAGVHHGRLYHGRGEVHADRPRVGIASRELRVRAKPGRRTDARAGRLALGRHRGAHRPCGGHALPARLLQGARHHHGGGHGGFRHLVPGHPCSAFRVRPVHAFSRRHRGHRADHRHGSRLLHPHARAVPRGDPHGQKRQERFRNRASATPFSPRSTPTW